MMFNRRSQRDFEDEIRSHLQIEVDRLVAQGMSPADAERAARRTFGNVGAAEDRFYHARPLVWLDDFARDARHAVRALLRTPAFLATSVITLALAIGAVAGMFDVVNEVMLRPLPFAHPERLVTLEGTAPGTDLPETFGLGDEFYVHYKDRSRLLAGVFSYGNGTSTLRVGDRVERIEMVWATDEMYATLGARPQLGRLPRTEDGNNAVVISDRLWESWFGRDPSVIGKWYFVSDTMKQVIGVMPPSFHFPRDDALLWVSSVVRPADVRPGRGGFPLVARVKDGVTTDRLAVELKQLAGQLPARFGGSANYAKQIGQFRPIITPLQDALVGPTVKTSLLILLGAVGVVLLVACANVANLFLVRAETRRRDLTVRRAIGASRAQLVRFQLTEAFVVALMAGILAVALAAVTLPIFIRAAPEGVLRLGEVHLDVATVSVAFGLVVFVALVCGRRRLASKPPATTSRRRTSSTCCRRPRRPGHT